MVKKVSVFFRELFEKDGTIKLLSIILAVLIWAVVSINVYPITETTVHNIPVEVLLENSYAEANQLSVISGAKQTVSVRISGKRADIGDITAEDLAAEADISNVMLPREYKLSVHITSPTGKKFEVVSIEPPTVDVSFDRIISKEFVIVPQPENVRIAPGYMSGDAVVNPPVVTVTGPQDTIDSITKVCAKVSPDRELRSAYEFNTGELILYNNNAIIANEDKLLSFDKNSFAIQIPVFVRQTLPLDVNIINAPKDFDLDYFRKQLEFSVKELDIAAPDDKIRELVNLNIGTINMREVNIGSVFSFAAEDFLPDGYENLTQIDTVTVVCPSEGLARKHIAIKGKDIQFINRPVQFEFEPVSSGMTLTVIGDAEQIESISKEDITAQIDLIDFDMIEGDHKMSVDFIISSYNRVWFNGEGGIATPKFYVTARLAEPDEGQE